MIPDIMAGETLKFRQSFSDYNPSTDTMVIDLVTDGYKTSITATDYGDGSYQVNVAYGTTDAWPPGRYYYQAYITIGDGGEDDGVRRMVREGSFKVSPKFSDMPDGHDNRSHVKKVLDALEDTIEGKASQDQLSYSIAGRSLSRMSPTELLDWRQRYQVEYKRELAAEKINAGLGTGNKVKVRIRA